MKLSSVFNMLLGEYRLIALAGIISIFGLIMISSASTEIALQKYNDAFALTILHSIYLVIAISSFYLMRYLPFQFVSRVHILILVFSIILLILVLIPGIGNAVNGARRWIQWQGFSFQPSEFAKMALIIFLAKYLGSKKKDIKLSTVWMGVLVTVVIASLILIQPDFGTMVVISFIAVGVFFVAGISYRLIASSLIVVAITFSVLLYLQPYRMKRIEALFNPWENIFDSGYQLTQALMAIGRGGWFGAGLGNSIQKFFHLPEAHTDFLIAVMIEELGLVSCLLLLFLYFLLVLRIVSIARQVMLTGNTVASLFVYGVFCYFCVQIGIAMGVNLALLPTTGISLPLFSYGGTNLLVSYLLLGLTQQIADTVINPKKKKLYSRTRG